MPKVGEEEFAYTPEGIEAAKAKSLETGVPTTNAPDRTTVYQIGGMVKPPEAQTGIGGLEGLKVDIPKPSPSRPNYKKGGKV